MQMTTNIEKIGKVEKRQDETEFEWKITDFFTTAENKDVFVCPTFSFVDTSWYFRMHPRSTTKYGFVNLFLIQMGNLDCSVEYNFGLKNVDGSVSIEHFSKGVLTTKSNNWHENGIIYRYTDSLFFTLSEVRQRKSEFASSDTLIVTCTLKRQNIHLKAVKAAMLMNTKLQKFVSK